MRTRFTGGLLILASSVIIPGCAASSGADKGNPPVMAPLSDTTVYVDTVFTLELSAQDDDGDAIRFGFTSDIEDIGTRADLRQAGNKAMFRWTPIAADVGVHTFDFTASDGKNTTKETITIDVQPQVGSNVSPIFRKPQGKGTILDLSKKKCLSVPIVVEDADSAKVSITEIGKKIEGAKLDQDSNMTAAWQWCPSKDQLSAADRYMLSLQADDGDGHKTRKDYLIVLKKPQKSGCPGDAPVIQHDAQDISSVVDISIEATVSDDHGIKYDPLLYYTSEKPSSPPDLATMTQLTMQLKDGDRRSGTWQVAIPNPVASQPAGSKSSLYYVIVAQDNDDENGDCDHTSQAPTDGTYEIVVTNPGGSGALAPCAPCSTDKQCGKDGDNCLRIGNEGNTYCGKGCSGDQDCPDGYHCPDTPYTSVDGATAKQCIPDTFSCDSGSGTCKDDDREPNDNLTQASMFPSLKPGDTIVNMVSCPGDASMGSNDDVFPLTLTDEGRIYLKLEGKTSTDLDMGLLDDNGQPIATAQTLSSNEHLERCLAAGTYFVDVYSWDTGQNTYSLWYDFEAATCVTTCDDDSSEDDDNAVKARKVDLSSGKYVSETNAICPYDEDWYTVDLSKGDTLYVSLTFDQKDSSEDLDVLLYQHDDGNCLTPCNATDMNGCDDKNGQSSTSDEFLTWPITDSDTYFVVVRGFDGASNLYDICMSTNPSDCPKPSN